MFQQARFALKLDLIPSALSVSTPCPMSVWQEISSDFSSLSVNPAISVEFEDEEDTSTLFSKPSMFKLPSDNVGSGFQVVLFLVSMTKRVVG